MASETVRGSNCIIVDFYYSVLPFVPLWQKLGVIFIFRLGMYFQTGQVIFVPEWPKGEFVRILASFWTKSIVCKDAVNRDSTIQSTLWRLCTAKKSVPCQPSGQSYHPVRIPICSLFHSSGRRAIPSGYQTDQASSIRTTCISVWTLHCVEKILSNLHPSGRLSSPSGRLSVLDQLQIISKFKYGKINSTVQTMWYPVRTRVSLRQES
jgi:hypothetical protein